ncbi:hypothetical protein MTO96_034765 [Rhipicephalus appendiculatus]
MWALGCYRLSRAIQAPHLRIPGALIAVATAFSAAANTRALLKVADKADADHYQLQFLHGLRFFSLAYIVMGHSYQTMSDTWCEQVIENCLSRRRV